MTLVAAIQMCSSHEVEKNLIIAERLIAEAVSRGAKLIVLPEMFPIMGLNDTDRVKIKEKCGEGKMQDFLSKQSRTHQVWLVGGTIPITCDDPEKVAAASLVFNDKGTLVGRYDKIHLFDVNISNKEKYHESATIKPGDTITVIPTPFGNVGLAVCYDIRFPELFRCLLKQGAEIIIVPAAFTVTTGEAHWELLIRSRAVENFCYVIGAAQGGQHTNGRKTYGHSLIVGPWGNVITKINGIEEGIITAEIDLNKLYELRKSIPTIKHQRIYCDTFV